MRKNTKICNNIKEPLTKEQKDFVVNNIEFAYRLAGKFARNRNYNIDDAKQIAAMGLMKASKMYDPSLGYKPEVYCHWHIKRYMHQYIHTDVVDRPEFFDLARMYLRKEIRKYVQKTNIYPDKQLQYSWIKDKFSGKIGDETIQNVINYKNAIYFEDYKDEKGSSWLNNMPSQEKNNIINDIDFKKNISKLNGYMTLFDDRQKFIIEHRFGLNNKKEMTLREIAIKYNVTRERIRQLEAKALNKLKYLMRNRD
jgi:RNA polymerase primary sigma factor